MSSYELKKAKSVISTKLHVGVAACAFGVGFRSVYGNEKTTTFLRQSEDLLENDGVYYSFKDDTKKKEIFIKYKELISDIVNERL